MDGVVMTVGLVWMMAGLSVAVMAGLSVAVMALVANWLERR